MKTDGEFTKGDLDVEHDMDVDCDIVQEILVSFECWFDVNRKFNINIAHDENTWLNMYGRYNPYDDTLSIECEIDREEGSSYFDYIPTNTESQLMKDLITARIHEVYRRSPKEFCEDALDNGIEIGEMQQ